VPWELICANLDKWIPANRRPFGSTLDDPGNLRLSAVVTWLEYFHMSQSGTIPPERHIQYAQVIAGPNPIDPSLSQESSRRVEFIPQQNKELWILEFKDTVTKCHAPGGIEYPDSSIKYGNALPTIRGKRSTSATPDRKIDDYLDLPTGNTHPTAVIAGQEKALLLKWVTALPEAYGTLIVELVDVVNELQFHLPATVSRVHLILLFIAHAYIVTLVTRGYLGWPLRAGHAGALAIFAGCAPRRPSILSSFLAPCRHLFP
jgi:hypothetical protein